MAPPGETAFLAAAAARCEEGLGGLSTLGAQALGLGRPAALALLATGLVLLVSGRRLRLLAGALGGAAVGALAGLALRAQVPEVAALASPEALAASGAAGLAVLSGLSARLLAFAAGALPGALLGALVPLAGGPVAGAALGAVVVGTMAWVAADLTFAAVVSSVGAALVGGGALGLLADRSQAREIVARPYLLLGVLALLTAAGATRQLRSGGGGRRGRAGPVSPPDRQEDP